MMPEEGFPLDLCQQCVRERGLCSKHHAGVLPLLSLNWGWLNMMADALVEQTKRQATTALSVSAEQAAHAARKKTARSTAAARRASGVAARNARQRSLERLAA